MHYNIVEHSDGEFDSRYDEGSGKAAPHESDGLAAVYVVQHSEDKSAGERHSPVSVASADDLDKAVKEITHKKCK